MAKIFLICGGIGAGKSSYSLKLVKELGGIYFATDEWMKNLYRDDLIAEMQYEWALERIDRIEQQMFDLAQQLIPKGIPVIFDLGLLQRAHRQKFYDLAKTYGFDVETHMIEVDKAIRWQRVEKRNVEKGETFSAEVTKDMFEFCETLFERPEKEEMKICKFIDNN